MVINGSTGEGNGPGNCLRTPDSHRALSEAPDMNDA